MVNYEEFYRGASRGYANEKNDGRPQCNVYASVTSEGDATANCDYDFTEIHYHIHFPENMDQDSLIEVLKFMKGDKALPEGETKLDDGTVIEKKSFWERLVHR